MLRTSGRCSERRTAVRNHNPEKSGRFAGAVADDLADGTGQRLVVESSGRRYQYGALEPFWVEVGELADHRTAHRVADQRHLLDALPIEKRRHRELGRVGDPAVLPLRPNPGRSGTKVWNSSMSASAVGSR